MDSFARRIWRASTLDAGVFREVQADRAAMSQAVLLVVLAALAAGIPFLEQAGALGILRHTGIELLKWWVWAYLTFFFGTELLPEDDTDATMWDVLRALGFASAPGLIRVLGVVPGLLGFVYALAGLWMLVAMVIAVREALQFASTLRAVAVCGIGFAVVLGAESFFASLMTR